jgi:hypothetical protein
MQKSNRFAALSTQEPKDKKKRRKNDKKKHKKTKDAEEVSGPAVEAPYIDDVPPIDKAATTDDNTDVIIQTTRWWNPVYLVVVYILLKFTLIFKVYWLSL